MVCYDIFTMKHTKYQLGNDKCVMRSMHNKYEKVQGDCGMKNKERML